MRAVQDHESWSESGVETIYLQCKHGWRYDPNVLYSMNRGLLENLKPQTRVRLIIINIGSNDLTKPGRSLSEKQLYQFALRLEALRRTSPRARIVVTALFHQRDVHLTDTDRSNDDLERLVSELPSTGWLTTPSTNLKKHFADHVHLNKAGYEICDIWLVGKLALLELFSRRTISHRSCLGTARHLLAHISLQ